MNKLTVEILTPLLQDEDAWDKKTRQLRIAWVRDEYTKAREALWMDAVYFPRVYRLFSLLRSWGVFPENAFTWEAFGFVQELQGWWLSDPCLSDVVLERFEDYFQGWWWQEEWEYEGFTVADVLALGVRPHLVPARQGQPSLF
jgi:hypothetical protein